MSATQGLFHPSTVEEAVALLARLEDVKILAGGATLVAMINARLAEPKALVSLARIEELRAVSALAGGAFRIGAMTRHRDVAAAKELDRTLSVLPRAASQIASTAVRNMGTIGGAVAHADPGLDYPPALVAAGAEIEIASAAGRRRVAAADFFVDWYQTALAPGEMVCAVHVPAPRSGVGIYHKHARVSGDFATVSVALSIAKSADGLATRAAIGACGPTPVMVEEANALLSGRPREAELRRAGELLQAATDPIDDVRGTAEYRRMLIPRMLARAFAQAQNELDALT